MYIPNNIVEHVKIMKFTNECGFSPLFKTALSEGRVEGLKEIKDQDTNVGYPKELDLV